MVTNGAPELYNLHTSTVFYCVLEINYSLRSERGNFQSVFYTSDSECDTLQSVLAVQVLKGAIFSLYFVLQILKFSQFFLYS